MGDWLVYRARPVAYQALPVANLGGLSLDKCTGIVMYTEGPCFGLDLIVDEMKVSCLMVVLSLGGVDALSR